MSINRDRFLHTTSIIGVLSLMMIAETASAQDCPPYPRMDEVHPSVVVTVSQSASGFSYSYSVTNLSDAAKPLIKFAVSVSEPVTQVGPPNWIKSGRMGDSTYVSWLVSNPTQSLQPGNTIGGFGFQAAALPSVVGLLAWNDFEPPLISGDPEVCKYPSILENSFKGSTVGPQTPPSTDRLQLVNYLISLLHQSRQAGWISTNGAHQDLLANLVSTKRKIESNDMPNARDQLQQFLDQVVQRSCQTPNCNNRPLNTEAYAVLHYNGQNLMGRL